MADCYAIISLLDFANQRTRMKVRGALLTGANFDAQLALVDTLKSTVDALTQATVADVDMAYGTKISSAPSSVQGARRENKLLVRYQKSGGGGPIMRTLIPAPDLTLANLFLANSEYCNLATTVVSNFVTAFEAYAKTADGDAVDVLDIKYVGRNL
jgi:hypothetical protein